MEKLVINTSGFDGKFGTTKLTNKKLNNYSQNNREIEEEKATKIKNEANDLFKEEKYLESLKIYEKGLKRWRKFLEKSGHDFENLLRTFYQFFTAT